MSNRIVSATRVTSFASLRDLALTQIQADLMRHLGKVSPDDIPPRYYLVSKDGSPTVPPPVVPPPEVSDPKPAEQARSRASDMRGASLQVCLVTDYVL